MDLHTRLNPLDLLPGHYDGVIAVSHGGPQSGLSSHKLLPIATVPVCAARLAGRDPPDFATVPDAARPAAAEDWRRWLNHAGLATVLVRNAGSYESIGLAIEAAAAGLGYAMAIAALLGPDLEHGAVAIAHPAARPTRRYFVLQYETRLARDPAIRDFTDWLCSQVPQGMPGAD